MVIQAAYRALARDFHPDMKRDSTDAARMRHINLAYEALSDPSRRAQYDAQLARARRATATHQSARARLPGWRGHRVGDRSEPHTRVPMMPLAGRAILVATILAMVLLVCLLGWLIVNALDDQPTPGTPPRSRTAGLTILSTVPPSGPRLPI
jgi:hypothetical protein